MSRFVAGDHVYGVTNPPFIGGQCNGYQNWIDAKSPSHSANASDDDPFDLRVADRLPENGGFRLTHSPPRNALWRIAAIRRILGDVVQAAIPR